MSTDPRVAATEFVAMSKRQDEAARDITSAQARFEEAGRLREKAADAMRDRVGPNIRRRLYAAEGGVFVLVEYRGADVLASVEVIRPEPET